MPQLAFTLSATGILLVFYLAMLFKWEAVKRPFFYMIGAVGVVLAIISGFFSFSTAKWARILITVFNTLGALIAFAGAFIACYGAKLPTDAAEAPAAPAAAPAPQKKATTK